MTAPRPPSESEQLTSRRVDGRAGGRVNKGRRPVVVEREVPPQPLGQSYTHTRRHQSAREGFDEANCSLQ